MCESCSKSSVKSKTGWSKSKAMGCDGMQRCGVLDPDYYSWDLTSRDGVGGNQSHQCARQAANVCEGSNPKTGLPRLFLKKQARQVDYAASAVDPPLHLGYVVLYTWSNIRVLNACCSGPGAGKQAGYAGGVPIGPVQAVHRLELRLHGNQPHRCGGRAHHSS